MSHHPIRCRTLALRVNPVAAGVAIALTGMVPVKASAQALGGNNYTDEIIVSATRRDARVQDVPYSIAALSDGDLADLQIVDLSGIARYTPGLIQVDQGARDANQLIMRGIGVSAINSPEFLANTNGDRVSVYYGETPAYVNLLPLDLQRVEVLRGPQGILFGARSLGGAIRYMPNAPDLYASTAEAHVRGYVTDASSGTSYDSDLVFNAPLIEGTLALRGLLGYSNQRGFIDYNYLVPNPGVSCPEPGFSSPDCSTDGFRQNRDANNVITRSYGLQLRWQPFDDLTATLGWRYQDRDIGGRQINSSEALGLIESTRGIDLDTGPYVSGLRFDEPNSRVNSITNLVINWNTALGEVTATTSFTRYDDRGQRDQTDLLLDLEPDDYYYYEEFPAFSAFTQDTRDDEVFTQEVRLVSAESDSRVDWLIGAFYQEGDFFSTSQEFVPGYAAFDPVFTTDQGDLEYDNKNFQQEREWAAYGEIGFQVTDKLNIRAGGRLFDYQSEIRNCTAFPIATTGFGGNPDVDAPENCDPNTGFQTARDRDFIGKLGLLYDVNDNISTYFTFSQGYSTGGVNARVDEPDVLNEKLVGPELTDNYELGIKSNWLDNRLLVNAALFYIDWTDIQVQGQTASGNFRITRNGSKARSQGVELDAVLRLNDHWSVGAGYAYTEAELAAGCTADQIADPTVSCALVSEPTASGDRLPGTPEHQGNLRVSYLTAINSELDLGFEYGMTAQSDVLTRIGTGGDCCRENGEALGGFALHYLSAALRHEAWTVTLFAENLFNKYAETGVRETRASLVTAGAPNDFTLRRYFKNVVRPRNIGVDFRYRFR
ncbi:MAG: TonB-dependent receptor [Gammaproteobacteria bacterium]|nr:TonB-dependent receptor [Gammaproteobacteria bacterium]